MISFINSKETCNINGYDYSVISNQLFQAFIYDDPNGDPYGKYTYYWEICSNGYSSNKCGRKGLAACSYVTETLPYGPVIDPCGDTSLNSTFIVDGDNSLIIDYQLNEHSGVIPCYHTNVFRSLSIKLSCSYGPLAISNVSQPSICQYNVTMSGSILCNLPKINTTTIPPITPLPTPPPTPPPLLFDCTFNEYNYSSLSNQLYSAKSVSTNQDDPNGDPYGKYTFYWEMCSNNFVGNQCKMDVISSCAIINETYGNEIYYLGMSSIHSFDNINGTPVLYYTLNNGTGIPYCNSDIDLYRSLSIYLQCSDGPLTISDVSQTSICQYKVIMSGSDLCIKITPTEPPPTTQDPIIYYPQSSSSSHSSSNNKGTSKDLKKIIMISILSFVLISTVLSLVYFKGKTILKNIQSKVGGNKGIKQKGYNELMNIDIDIDIDYDVGDVGVGSIHYGYDDEDEDIASTDIDDVYSPKINNK